MSTHYADFEANSGLSISSVTLFQLRPATTTEPAYKTATATVEHSDGTGMFRSTFLNVVAGIYRLRVISGGIVRASWIVEFAGTDNELVSARTDDVAGTVEINNSVVIPHPLPADRENPGTIKATRGSTLRRTWEDFGDLDGATAGWFGLKEATTAEDADALLWVTLADGLVILNGEEVDLDDADLASLTIDGDGLPVLFVAAEVMAQIANVNARLPYGLQFNTPDTVEDVGSFLLAPDVVRATE